MMQLERRMNQTLSDKMYLLMDRVLAQSLKDNKWFERLAPIVKDAIELVQPSTMNNDNLNITYYIKIKKVLYQDASLTKLVKGLVIRKNIVHKKMESTIEHPKILVIKGNLEPPRTDDSPIMDMSSISREEMFLEEIIKKIAKLGPNIVVVEGSVNRFAQEKLLANKLTLVMKIREKQLKKILRFTNAKLVEDLSRFDLVDEKYLGTCENFTVMNYNNKKYYELNRGTAQPVVWESFDPSIMYFDGNNPEVGVTIVISGPNEEELKQIKKSLQAAIIISRNLVIERGVIMQDILLYNSKDKLFNTLFSKRKGSDDEGSEPEAKKGVEDFRDQLTVETDPKNITEVTTSTCLLNESTSATAGYSLKFYAEKLPIEKLFTSTHVKLTKLILVPLDYSTFPDLANLNITIKERLSDNLYKTVRFHRDCLCQIGDEPRTVTISYYDKGDMSLGNFLLHKWAKVTEKCMESNRFYYNHITFFFCNKVFVKITLELKEGARLQMIRKESKKTSYTAKPTESGGSNPAPKDGFFDFLATVAPIGNKNNPKVQTSSLPFEPPKKDIYMYIECAKCRAKISESVKLKKTFLEYSFAQYLKRLIDDSEQYLDYLINYDTIYASNTFTSDAVKRHTLKPCCALAPKNRVFIVDDLLVRVRIGYAYPYSLYQMPYTQDKAMNLTKASQERLIKNKKTNLLEMAKSYLHMILNNLKSMLNFLIEKSKVNLTLETLDRAEQIFNNNNPLSKDPYNKLLLGLAAIYKDVQSLRGSTDKIMGAETSSHLEVDYWRKELYEKLAKLAEILEKKKDDYNNDINAERALLMNSVSSPTKTNPTGDFELDDLKSRPYDSTPSHKLMSQFSGSIDSLDDEASPTRRHHGETIKEDEELQKESKLAELMAAGMVGHNEILDPECPQKYVSYFLFPLFTL